VRSSKESRLSGIAFAFLLLLLTGTVLEALMPLLLGAALGAALTDTGLGLLFAGALAVAVLLAVACNVARHVVGGRWTIQRQTAMRTEVGEAITAETQRSVGASHVGTVLGSDISRIAGYPIAVMRWAAAMVGLVIVAVYLLWLSIPLALIVLVGVPLFMWITQLASAPLEARQEALRDRVGRISAMSSDIALGLRSLWAVGARASFLARLQRENRRAQAEGLRLATAEAVLLSVGVLLPGVMLVGLIAAGGALLEAGALAPSALVTFYAASAYLVGPIQTTATVLQVRSAARVAERRRAEVTAPSEEPTNVITAVDADRLDPTIIAARRLSVLHPGEDVVVDHLADMSADEVARRADVDASGGRPRVQYENPAIFSGTIRELVDPRGEANDETIVSAIHAAAADDVVERLDDGLDEVIGEGGRRLSGGQRQRLILARSLLGDPGALVLVRPTSALDVATEAETAQRVASRRHAHTTIVITESTAFDEGAAAVAELGRTM